MTHNASKQRVLLDLRPPKSLRVYVAIFSVVWIVGVVVNVIAGSINGSGLVVLPFGLVMMAFGGFVIWRTNRLGLSVCEDELVVRNYYRTCRVARSSIEGFRIGRPGMMLFGKTIHIVTEDTIVTCDAFVWSSLGRRGTGRLQGYIRDLRAWCSNGSTTGASDR